MALEKAEDIEALADGLTAFADAMHKRTLKAIKAGTMDQAAATTLFQKESSLRQKADSLYADAVQSVVVGLDLDQADLLKVIKTAKERIQAIEDLRKGMEIFGDLIVLCASVVARKPGPIVAAVKEIRDDLKATT